MTEIEIRWVESPISYLLEVPNAPGAITVNNGTIEKQTGGDTTGIVAVVDGSPHLDKIDTWDKLLCDATMSGNFEHAARTWFSMFDVAARGTQTASLIEYLRTEVPMVLSLLKEATDADA